MNYEELKQAAKVFHRMNNICSYVTKERFAMVAKTRFGIDDDQDVTYSKKEEAQKEWSEFINKYFDIPSTIIANWNVGIYDLEEHKWVERYDKKED